METTLLSKTMAILISQLSIVFVGAYSFIFLARRATLKGVKFFGETFEAHYNSKGQLDLLHIPTPEEERVIKYNADGEEIDDSIFGTLNGFFTYESYRSCYSHLCRLSRRGEISSIHASYTLIWSAIGLKRFTHFLLGPC